MPYIDIKAVFSKLNDRGLLSDENVELCLGIINSKTGRLRATKPKDASGKTRYLWRMVAFMASPKAEHHHMPVTADFDLLEDEPFDLSVVKARADRLKPVEDAILDSLPTKDLHGLHAWGSALGMI